MKRLALALLLAASPVSARESLGVFSGWGAFRDDVPLRCFAIAQPMGRSEGAWRPFAAVSHWPRQRVRSQLHIRLSRERKQGAPLALMIDDRRFPLISGGADAWAPDPRFDAAIVAAMRSGRVMSVATVATSGERFADTYRLKGAATAIDAAALGCAQVR